MAIKNKNSERIVIGILINHPDWVIETKGLRQTQFFDKNHKVVFHIITLLIKENAQTIDSLVILARAEKVKDFSDIIDASGGYEYLEFIRGLAVPYNKNDLFKHVEVIQTCAYKRDQQTQKEEFLRLLHDKPELSIAEVNQWLHENQFALQADYTSGGDIRLIGEVIDEVWAEIVAQRGKDGTFGIPSKIATINDYFTYQRGELVVIGARAKYGKSNFGINEAHHKAVVKGIPTAIFDTEMKTRKFLARIIAIDSGVALKRIEEGSYASDPDEYAMVETSKKRIAKAPLIHKYSYNWDKANVRENALLLKARHGIEFLIYDYIKVKEVGGAGQAKEHSELGNWTIHLKDLAGEMDVPILTFGQLSPYETRLADSDKINRYASTIAYLLPKDSSQIARDNGIQIGGSDMMYIDYNRNGASMNDPTKGINLFYTRNNVTFTEADYQVLGDEYQ